MNFERELGELREELDVHEQRRTVRTEWQLLDARAAQAVALCQYQIAGLQRHMTVLSRNFPPDPRWQEVQRATHRLVRVLDELQIIRMCTRSRVLEHQAAARQRA